MPRKVQEFKVNLHLPEDPEVFRKAYSGFLYGIAKKTLKKLPPDEQEAYALKYIKVFAQK